MKPFYWIMWFIVGTMQRAYYKRMYLSGLKNIPRNRPFILACNHPNTFLDAITMAPNTSRELSFFARSDAFNTPTKKKILGLLNMHPIYRILEGKENLYKNDETFDIGYSYLKRKKGVLIHSEGICIVEKRLRPLKKGTGRMAFNAENLENFTLNTLVVPVGFNYTYPTRFQADMIVTIGEPFPVSEFKEIYRENQARAMTLFNERLKAELQKVVIHIQERKSENLVERLHIMYRNENIDTNFPWRKSSPKRFNIEKGVADKVNRLAADNVEGHDNFDKKTKEYFQSLKKAGTTDEEVARRGRDFGLNIAVALLLLPMALQGLIMHGWMVRASDWIARKTAGVTAFYAAVRVGSFMVLNIIQALLLMIPLFIIFDKWAFLVYLTGPVAGYIAIHFIEALRRIRSSARFFMMKDGKNKKSKLYLQRKEIIDFVNNL